MASKWKRIIPTSGQVGQIQAVQAKKHLTQFSRSPRAPGAGRPAVKGAFTECAHATLGEPDRNKRIARVADCMRGKGLRTGVIHKKSRARPGSPLYGKVYTLGGAGA
jgi:NAD(P)H-dependent FMN reductase